MHELPLISICIFTYNYGRFLAQAIDAALAQTYGNIEVVVCDNASTDDTQAVLARYAGDPRVRSHRNAENIGWMRNHKRAIELARGTLVVAIPADDVLLPTFCERAYAHLAAHAATTDIVYASVAYADLALAPHTNGACPGLLPGAYAGGRNEFRELLRMDHIRWPVMLSPRELLLQYANFDESLHAQADWDALLAMAANGVRFGFIPIVGGLIRRHTEQCSADGSFVGTIRELEDYLTIHERYVDSRHHALFAGSERTLIADFEHLTARIAARASAPFSDAVQTRIATYRARLAALSAAPAPPATPQISVILTTTGNDFAGLQRALASLAAQTERSFELIVVQRGGQSVEAWLATLPLAEKMRFFFCTHAVTAAAARNIGIRLSNAPLLTYLDDAASFAPDHLAKASGLLSASGALAVAASASLTLGGMRAEGMFALGTGGLGLAVAPLVPAAALMHRYEGFERVGGFAESLPIWDDWHFALSLARDGELAALPTPSVDIWYEGYFHATPFGAAGAAATFGVLDSIYAAVPVATAHEASLRVRYLEACRAAWPADANDLQAVGNFLLTLAARTPLTAALLRSR